jgi:hypothetical protein
MNIVNGAVPDQVLFEAQVALAVSHLEEKAIDLETGKPVVVLT